MRRPTLPWIVTVSGNPMLMDVHVPTRAGRMLSGMRGSGVRRLASAPPSQRSPVSSMSIGPLV